MIAASADDDVAGVAMPHRPCRRALATSRIDPILPPPFDDRMGRDEAAAIEDADNPGQPRHALGAQPADLAAAAVPGVRQAAARTLAGLR